MATATVGSSLTRSLWAREVSSASADRFFYFAIVADSHIIDSFYHGQESNALDTESLQHSAANLTSARTLINSLSPKIEQAFVVGDYFHNYPSPDYDFYFQNNTRLDNAKAITDQFKMPVHIGFGNHDYGVPDVSREMSHRLFEANSIPSPTMRSNIRGTSFSSSITSWAVPGIPPTRATIGVQAPLAKSSSIGLKRNYKSGSPRLSSSTTHFGFASPPSLQTTDYIRCCASIKTRFNW
jgi:hypothetical protein